MKSERIVLTGAFGYIGLAFIARLADRYSIRAVGHPPRTKTPFALPSGVEVVHGDLRLAARALAEGSASLVHLAGGGGEAHCRAEPVAAARTIVRGTARLVEAARATRARRILFASTIAVYGTFRSHGAPYSETDEVAPDDLYGVLKEAAEHAWTCFGGGTALRIANVYGAGSGVDVGVAGAPERFARAAARGEELTLYGDGSQKLDLVHVDDVVRAFERALQVDSLPPAVNIGSGRPVAVTELAEACIRAGEKLGKRPRLVRLPAPEGKIWPDRSLSIDLAASVLGWQPAVGLQEGVDELVRMMHDQSRGEEA